MASTAEFVQYTADQLSEAGKITYRKMSENMDSTATVSFLQLSVTISSF